MCATRVFVIYDIRCTRRIYAGRCSCGRTRLCIGDFSFFPPAVQIQSVIGKLPILIYSGRWACSACGGGTGNEAVAEEGSTYVQYLRKVIFIINYVRPTQKLVVVGGEGNRVPIHYIERNSIINTVIPITFYKYCLPLPSRAYSSCLPGKNWKPTTNFSLCTFSPAFHHYHYYYYYYHFASCRKTHTRIAQSSYYQ